MKKLTIYDIAKLSGVSKSTVSRFLNGGYVSKKNQQRLQAVIAEHDFKPSQSAITLRTKASKTLGMIIPRIESFTASRVVKGVMERANRYQYSVELINTELQRSRELAAYDQLAERNVQGIIAMATHMSAEYEQLLQRLKVPVVIFGQQTEVVPCICHDVEAAISDFFQSLLGSSSVKKISLLSPALDDNMLFRSVSLIQNLCRQQGIEVKLFETDYSWESGHRIASQAYQHSPYVMCMTDNIAYGVYKFAQQGQHVIGRDIHISGIGGYDTSMLLTPELSTIKYPYKRVGLHAVDMLLRETDHTLEPLGYELVHTSSFNA